MNIEDCYEPLGVPREESMTAGVSLTSQQVTNYAETLTGQDDQIINREKCYLSYNTGRENEYYKSSQMIDDLISYSDQGNADEGNVCGIDKYAHTDTDPVSGDIVESCNTCGQRPPNSMKDYGTINSNPAQLDHDPKTLNIAGPEQTDSVLIGQVPIRNIGDFEQDYTMYKYGIENELVLENILDPTSSIKVGEPVGAAVINIYETYGTSGADDKLTETEFLDIQRQCSPLISEWFPSQHAKNRMGQLADMFDLNNIDWGSSNLLDSNPVSIQDYFIREYNLSPELDKVPEGKYAISGDMLFEDNNNSILNHIRTMNVDGDLSDTPDLTRYPHLMCSENTVQDQPSVDRCIGERHMGIPVMLAKEWISKRLDWIKKQEPTETGNLNDLYGDLSTMFADINPQIETCINDIIDDTEGGQDIIDNIRGSRGDFTNLGDREIQYIRRKILLFIHSSDDRIRECIDMMYLDSSSNLCTEGLYNKTLKILTVLFSLVGINVDLSDVETNTQKYNSVMNFIDSLGDLFPRAIEKVIGIIQKLEKELCNTSNRTDIIQNLYDDLINKNRVYNVEMGPLGKLFQLDDKNYSRIVDTYNMVSPVLGRLFGPGTPSANAIT